MPDRPLAGKTAVVTGAGRGIGKSIAVKFAKAGADLAICARSKPEIDAVKALIEAEGQKCIAQPIDIAEPHQVTDFCKAVLAEFSTVDIIVNNAGAYLERGSFQDSDPDKWWRTMEVNVRGPYMLTRGLIAAMNSGGKIINLTSGKGYAAGANSSAYHVSKAALNMFTDALANELWQRDIDVNSLVPGPTATATFDNDPDGTPRSAEEILAKDLPPGLPPWERVKHPNEVAELALFIAGGPTKGPTGQVFSLARRPM